VRSSLPGRKIIRAPKCHAWDIVITKASWSVWLARDREMFDETAVLKNVIATVKL
jgi:hypothetical protein